MKIDTHGNGNKYDDLYIYPENEKERSLIAHYLQEHKLFYQMQYSDVEGQEWYGHVFFDVPFMACLKDEIVKITD
jgi:hypothetical protein